MSGRRTSRLLLSVAVVATVAAACAGAPRASSASSASPTGSVDLAPLHAAVTGTATDQAALAPPLVRVLSAARELDTFVEGLRDPARFEATVAAGLPAAGPGDGLGGGGVAAVREDAEALVLAVGHTRDLVEEARGRTSDPWLVRYLAAEDAVLEAVRGYARSSGALAEVLLRHLPTYREVHQRTARFLERRDAFRSAEEASAAYEVEVGRSLDDLAAARDAIAGSVRERDAAAAAVNEASAVAAELWEERPAPSTSGTGP